MLQLFFLILFSSFSFSLYLYTVKIVQNPLIFVLLGWGTVVLAYYASHVVDLFNKQYQAYVINGSGEYWTGSKFSDGGDESEPFFVINDVQVEKTVRRIQKITQCNDLYIRILPDAEEIDNYEEN